MGKEGVNGATRGLQEGGRWGWEGVGVGVRGPGGLRGWHRGQESVRGGRRGSGVLGDGVGAGWVAGGEAEG